jgi:hypothetical protein
MGSRAAAPQLLPKRSARSRQRRVANLYCRPIASDHFDASLRAAGLPADEGRWAGTTCGHSSLGRAIAFTLSVRVGTS